MQVLQIYKVCSVVGVSDAKFSFEPKRLRNRFSVLVSMLSFWHWHDACVTGKCCTRALFADTPISIVASWFSFIRFWLGFPILYFRGFMLNNRKRIIQPQSLWLC